MEAMLIKRHERVSVLDAPTVDGDSYPLEIVFQCPRQLVSQAFRTKLVHVAGVASAVVHELSHCVHQPSSMRRVVIVGGGRGGSLRRRHYLLLRLLELALQLLHTVVDNVSKRALVGVAAPPCSLEQEFECLSVMRRALF